MQVAHHAGAVLGRDRQAEGFGGGVEVAFGEGVIVQVGVSVQVGTIVCVGGTAITASVVAGRGVAVLVGVATISTGRDARLPGKDQIAGSSTWTIGAGRLTTMWQRS